MPRGKHLVGNFVALTAGNRDVRFVLSEMRLMGTHTTCIRLGIAVEVKGRRGLGYGVSGTFGITVARRALIVLDHGLRMGRKATRRDQCRHDARERDANRKLNAFTFS